MQKVANSKILKTVISTLVSICLCGSNVLAADTTLKENVREATQLIEDVFKDQYEQKKKELINIIKEREYDSTLTLQTFYDNGNIFKDVNYLNLIATYGTIKEYYQKKHLPLQKGLKDIPFISMNLTEECIEETVPVLIPIYTDLGNGQYELDGNQMIYEETIVSTYEVVEGGTYIVTGETTVSPEIERTVYGNVILSLISNEDILKYFGVTEKEIETTLLNRVNTLQDNVTESTLNQSVFINNRKAIEDVSELTVEELSYLIEQSGSAKGILQTAISMIGQIPYQWGGKPSYPGYDKTWWTFENNEQKGLDCSGFVKWVFMTTGYDATITDSLNSTASMMNLESVNESDLKPGDLGLLNYGETTNHVGIYLGDGYYIHCTSGKNTVVVDQFPFTHFKRVNYMMSDIDTLGELVYYPKYTPIDIKTKKVAPEDVLLLAQLLENEAGNQGYNGMVAAGEVVMNRIASEDYPNTLREVIYEKGQFSYVERISDIEPREETKLVAEDILNGNIGIFNNPQVLFFRNPMITNGIPASEQTDWGNKEWYGYVGDVAFYVPK